MTERTTEQETFWEGEFGDSYVERNAGPNVVARRTAAFAPILRRTIGVESVIEFGANIGTNLEAIHAIIPDAKLSAIEINEQAAAHMQKIGYIQVFKGSMLELAPVDLGQHDLTFTSGVLIHINPDHLGDVYQRLYACSRKYIMVNEYYNPTPVEVEYRGHSNRMFKRDFAGDILDKFPDLELVDYGFQYHRDNNFPADDSTWFLMRKRDAN